VMVPKVSWARGLRPTSSFVFAMLDARDGAKGGLQCKASGLYPNTRCPPKGRSPPLDAGLSSSTPMSSCSPPRWLPRPIWGKEPHIGCGSALPHLRGHRQPQVIAQVLFHRAPSPTSFTIKARHQWWTRDPAVVAHGDSQTTVAPVPPPSWPTRGGLRRLY
jgi:hypothetical protein